MTDTPKDPVAAAREMLADLQLLVEAIDRRVPHLERLNEPKIARDAAELRRKAVTLIHAIEDGTSTN
jgi:Tfp pilus assembly ATPase PilU